MMGKNMDDNYVEKIESFGHPATKEGLSLKDVLHNLRKNRKLLRDRFGVTRIGIFGSFVRGEQSASSDIDMIVEIEPSKKNIHCFLQLKRFLENETARRIDIGFEHTLKPIVKERIRKQVVYV
jgi:predicted nucleotidyltransferase